MNVRRILASTLSVALVLALPSPSWGAPATTRVVSRTQGGTLGDTDSSAAVVSASGRYVAFASIADNLPGDDDLQNVYRKDMKTGGIRLVSRTRGGDQADGDSFDPSISANGRYVAFGTEADNLPGDDLFANIVLKDMQTGRVLLISRNSSGDPADDSSFRASISANGRFVAFESSADNLPGEAESDVYIHDLETRRTRLISKTSSGEPANEGDCNDAAVSSSGRFVAFECEDTTNMPGQGAASGGDQTYVHDRQTGRTRLVSKTTGGDPADGDSEDPSISGGGRYVAFESEDATNLPGIAAATGDQSYVHDRQTGRTRLVSKTTGGEPADGDSGDPAISANGRYVAFVSESTNLPQPNESSQVYRHDRERGRTILISRNNAGEVGDDGSGLTEHTSPISADGSFIVFSSVADNLGGGSMFEQVYRRGPLA